MKQFLFFLILLCLFCFNVNAQTEETSSNPQTTLVLIARNYGDSIVLRWGATKPSNWLLANQVGYTLQRAELSYANPSGFKTIGTFKPYTLKEWISRCDTANPIVATAAQCLLSKAQYDPRNAATFSMLKKASEEQQHRFAFAMLAADYSAQAATGLGLRTVDRQVEKGKKYMYRIFINSKEFKNEEDTTYLPIATFGVYKPHQVTEVSAEAGDSEATIFWNKAENSLFFSGYYVEKSTDGKRFERMNKLPIRDNSDNGQASQVTFKDTLIQNYKPYWYRVVGITAFGDEGGPSEAVKIEAKDLSGPIPPSNVWILNQTKGFLIKWSGDKLTTDHAGFYVGRSISINGPFERLNTNPLPKQTTEYIDNQAIGLFPYYYIVYAVDDKGNENASMVAMGVRSDNVPPAAPKGLKGDVSVIEMNGEKKGLVVLTWDMNKEEDFIGYRIHTANAQNRQFYELSHAPFIGNFWLDTITLNSLSEKIYYKVFANDMSMNTSAFSDVLELAVPDIVAPVSPVIENYETTDKNITISWQKSHSKDVVSQRLWRKQDNSDWVLVADFKDNLTTIYKDSTAKQDIVYNYAIEAIDDAGLASGKSFPLRVVLGKTNNRLTVNNLKGEFDEKEKVFRLTWDYPQTNDNQYKFVIYRATNAGELLSYGAASATEMTFTDHEFYYVEKGYEYAVKVIFADGSESPLSALLKVVF